MCLELGEGHFDRIEIGAVWRQEQEPSAPLFEDCCGLFAFVAAQIIQDDDVTWLKRRGELGFDIGLEDLPVHRSVDNPRRRQTVAAQGGDEGLGPPMTEWSARPEALTSTSPAVQPRHLRRRSRLVDEDKPMRFLAHPGLPMPSPDLTVACDLSAIGFAGQQCFF